MTLTQMLSPPKVADSELHNGDRMTQKEFHKAYLKTPEGFKAELIGGIVYVASPLQLRHGRNHLPLGSLFFFYEGSTPGVESADNMTVILGEDSEPQPDLFLRVSPDHGGTSANKGDYCVGPPELVAEISHSSKAIDLHAKRNDYQKYGVQEYLVVLVKEKLLRWFDLTSGKELFAKADGVIRIKSFPGLWIQGHALLNRDVAALMTTLQQGLATPEHAEFVKKLSARAGGKAKA